MLNNNFTTAFLQLQGDLSAILNTKMEDWNAFSSKLFEDIKQYKAVMSGGQLVASTFALVVVAAVWSLGH